ncbi:Tam3-transposase (Ac family) protein [Dioscorea alata]|uniref:Tam3-transposase (Ac family) protein n=1 Tax=Dioscorea alata TaxID=55571 RepID=A0ACB7UDA7_DIOAL|nr:Tam3-transposase (Ac family) protein [Dioscorea alata]
MSTPISQQSNATPSVNESEFQHEEHEEENEEVEVEHGGPNLKRGRKKISKVWDVFEVIEEKEHNFFVKKHKCKYCHRKYTISKSGTTTHLKRHLVECPYYKNVATKQSTINFLPIENDFQGMSSYVSYPSTFDMMKIRDIITKMVIVHEYPFNMVEHVWFNVLLKTMNPQYEKISRNTIKNDCMKLYEHEREKLIKTLKHVDRISLTSDTWTSNQTIGYMCLTIHFIDANWKLQKRIISFYELEPPHTGLVISDAIFDCLLDWGIQDKVSTITLDNASSNDVVARHLKSNFESRDKLHFKGKFFHIQCCAHILNLMVQDGLKEIEEIIYRIRESVKYLKKSPGRLHKFGEIARQLNISTKKGLCIDVPTRWNSTYNMIDGAIVFQSVFDQYAVRDANYKWLPSFDDWEKAKKIAEFLEVFHDVTHIFSGTLYPTANLFLPEIWKVKEVLDIHAESSDYFMQRMALLMRGKFDKYWGDCNMLMAISAVLDPRYKMVLINFCFHRIYSNSESERNILEVKQTLWEIYEMYATEQVSHSTSNSAHEVTNISMASSSNTCGSYGKKYKSKGRSEFDDFIKQNNTLQPMKNELEIYLEEDVVRFGVETDSTFDVLDWWKVNVVKFRILSKMAHDILSVHVTTVASESAFSAGGRVLDKYRSSLAPKTVDALVCTSDWLKAEHGNMKSKVKSSIIFHLFISLLLISITHLFVFDFDFIFIFL